MTTATFTDALQVEVATLQAQHPILAGALDRAYTLLAAGGLFPLDDGRTAHVQSQSNPTVSHLVNGTCDCKATQYHAAPCAHRLAFRVYQRTVERLTVDPEDERWEPVAGPEAPAPLPEAPASVNVRLQMDGREVQLTLRDTNEGRLLQRLAAMLQQYPLPQPAPQAPTQPQGQGKDWCARHQVPMKQTTKDGRSWWSHKTADGWCQGK